jgi:cysteine sulfinate desulfinase/cysteine desulfurase-like protein
MAPLHDWQLRQSHSRTHSFDTDQVVETARESIASFISADAMKSSYFGRPKQNLPLKKGAAHFTANAASTLDAAEHKVTFDRQLKAKATGHVLARHAPNGSRPTWTELKGHSTPTLFFLSVMAVNNEIGMRRSKKWATSAAPTKSSFTRTPPKCSGKCPLTTSTD